MPSCDGIFLKSICMRKILIIIAIALMGVSATAQQLPDSLRHQFHMNTWQELMNHDQPGVKDITPTAPPEGPVRSIAEWEQNEGVIVAYPHSQWYGGYFAIPVDLIRQLAEIVHVHVIYEDSDDLSDLQDALNDGDVDMDNLSLHNIPLSSEWTRDYSPWFIASSETPEVGIVNFDYNRDRPDDNNVPVEMGNILNLDVYGMDVVHTGGNYMSDGMGKAASTNLVYTENSISDSEVDARMEEYLGITDYITVDDPLGEYIEHIDCWGKFLDVDKIMIAEVPQTDGQYDEYEAVADYFENHLTSYGTNYEVYRVYSEGQPFTNTLIMNGHVFIPVSNDDPLNTGAVEAYQEAMPGYDIITIPYDDWATTDALHCRTHEVPDMEMLYIEHVPLSGGPAPYLFSAKIQSYGAYQLDMDSVGVYWKMDDMAYQWQPMTPAGEPDMFEAYLPMPVKDQQVTVQYYIHAEDISGREANHPYIGRPDPHMFEATISGLDKQKQPEARISAFPNPVGNTLFISFYDMVGEDGSLQVLSANGVLLKEKYISATGAWNIERMDVSDLAEGTYILRFVGSSISLQDRFVRMK